MYKTEKRPGFSLIELLVVIGIIALLASLLLPSLASVKERSRRVRCKSQIRQFLLVAHMYATDYADYLPTGAGDGNNTNDEHTPVIAKATRATFKTYSSSDRILECPSLGPPFNSTNGWFFEGYGFVIGYNYLGGHHATPWSPPQGTTNIWISPQKLSGNPLDLLVTDMNDWSQSYGQIYAPHGERGPILKKADPTNPPYTKGIPSGLIGGKGGNQGSLDGSVAWKEVKDMRRFHGSHLWDEQGCYAAW